MLPRLKNTAYLPSWVDDFESKVSGSMPTVNIREDESFYILDVAAPGMEKKDFTLELIHNDMTISAEKGILNIIIPKKEEAKERILTQITIK